MLPALPAYMPPNDQNIKGSFSVLAIELIGDVVWFHCIINSGPQDGVTFICEFPHISEWFNYECQFRSWGDLLEELAKEYIDPNNAGRIARPKGIVSNGMVICYN